MRKLLAMLLTAVLLIPVFPSEAESMRGNSFGSFSGTVETNARLTVKQGSWPFFSRLFYLPSTLPEKYSAHEICETISLESLDGKKKNVKPEACSLEFVSGPESLRNAVELDYDSDKKIFRLIVSPEKLTEAGNTVFRFRAEGEGLYYEKEVTLTVLSWEKYPLFDAVNPYLRATVSQGEGETTEEDETQIRLYKNNTNLYTSDELLALLLRDHTAEVAEACLNADQREETDRIRATAAASYVLKPAGQYPEDELWTGKCTAAPYSYAYYNGFQFRKAGKYEFRINPSHSNISVPAAVITALAYSINGPEILQPGMDGTFTVKDSDPGSGRTFSLSAEGDGISFDPDTGVLSVIESVPAGTLYTISAQPSDGQPAARMTGTVSDGLLFSEKVVSGQILDSADMTQGFSVPVLAGPKEYRIWQARKTEDGGVEAYGATDDEEAPYAVEIEYSIRKLDGFAEEPETAENVYSGVEPYENAEDVQLERITLDGHPAQIRLMKINGQKGAFSCGELLFARNNRLLVIAIYCTPQNGTEYEAAPRITMTDMRKLAEQIVYDPSTAPLTLADGVFTLNTKEGTDTLPGGQRLNMQAVFASPEKVNANEKNDTLIWTVTGPEGSTVPAGISIDKNGVLSADRKISAITHAEVRAESPLFHTSAVYPFTVYPAVKSFTLEPAELFLYAGTDASAEVRAVLQPEGALARGITWIPDKEGLLEVTVTGENTAQIKALSACKTSVTVTEPSGWHVKLPVSVIEPVKSVTLSVTSKAYVGGKCWIVAEFEPAKPENPAVEWSLNVGEDIATINRMGLLSVKKNVPVGTAITVFCKALGAPEPVIGTIELITE